jgi:hypothetical protein
VPVRDRRYHFRDVPTAQAVVTLLAQLPRTTTEGGGGPPAHTASASYGKLKKLTGASGLHAEAADDEVVVAPVEGGKGFEQLLGAVDRLMSSLGALDPMQVEERERARGRDCQLAEAVGGPTTGPELLAALEAIPQDELLRFERVFILSLRTTVAAGAVLEGQRAEALRILKRIAEQTRA